MCVLGLWGLFVNPLNSVFFSVKWWGACCSAKQFSDTDAWGEGSMFYVMITPKTLRLLTCKDHDS